MVDEASITERQNSASRELDKMPTEAILRLMNEEDRRVPEAIGEVLPRVAAAVDVLVEAWRRGARWIYVGAGTSGRLAAMDAAECPPTFGTDPERVRALVAGGEGAAARSVEAAEDDPGAAVRDLEALDLTPDDAVVGLAASGTTPYVVSAVRHAAATGCTTVGISNNPDSELGRVADIAVEVLTGPEVLAGSTRLKAGTAQKLVLNMLSTAAFARLGKVYKNFMVDVQVTNEKLRRRACRIVSQAAQVSEDEARELLRTAESSTKVAVVMGKAKVSADVARTLLAGSHGSVRQALNAAEGNAS